MIESLVNLGPVPTLYNFKSIIVFNSIFTFFSSLFIFFNSVFIYHLLSFTTVFHLYNSILSRLGHLTMSDSENIESAVAPEQTPEQVEQVEDHVEEQVEDQPEETEEYTEQQAEDDAEEAPLDEQVYKLKSHKRKGSVKGPKAPKEQRRARTKKHEPEPEQDSEPEEELDDAARERKEIEARMDAALKKPGAKRKRLAGDDLEQLQDERIARLREEMREAAMADGECIENGKPALNKVKMLPEVVNVLTKHSLADSILDGNLLESVRIWLEPLPDASLPSYEIQKELFNALDRLPIKTIHLRESKLGQVVLFYQKSKRPHPQIKRLADKLVGDWTRPIMGRSDNYRDKRVATRTFDPTADLGVRQKARGGLTPAEEAAIRRNRAAIPTARTETYSVAPMSNISASSGARGSGDTQQLRRMKAKLMSSKGQSSRKSKVSVEGRGLH